MILYHYTSIRNLDRIWAEGLFPSAPDKDTLTINSFLMQLSHPSKVNRNSCLFLSPQKPTVKDGVAILTVNSRDLDTRRLFAAEFYYADALWRNLKARHPKESTLLSHANNYWDSLVPFASADFSDSEIEYELLYFGGIPPSFLRRIK